MFLWGLWIDPLYIVLFVVTLVISGAAQLYIKSHLRQVERGRATVPVSPARRSASASCDGSTSEAIAAARPASTSRSCPATSRITSIPAPRPIGLSQEVASRDSVAAMAVTAHEVGHAQQDAEGTVAMRARAFLVPARHVQPDGQLPAHLRRASSSI